MSSSERYIGLMSGTSMDGMDGVLCSFSADGRLEQVIGHAHRPFDPALRDELAALQAPGPNELHRAALAANALALHAADVCHDLLDAAQLERSEIHAIGMHGQTVRHQPGRHDGIGYTLQLNQPALLAERCGIDVVADFRSRDVAAGGQGAPLVPPFHEAVFGDQVHASAVVNIGGISNLTVLDPARPLFGFDCGPGNALLDHWCQRHRGESYDAAGRWAAGGTCLSGLLATLMADPYLSQQPPKSTGRDLFNEGWLQTALQGWEAAAPQDIQATLSEFTAAVIADNVERYVPSASEVLVCGGGASNLDLMHRLQRRLGPKRLVQSTAARGLPPLQVEAAAFAWLARMHCHGEPAGRAGVTGARGNRVLGARYPA